MDNTKLNNVNQLSMQRRKLYLLLDQFCTQVGVKAKPVATELKEIIKSKDCLPSILSEVLRSLLPKEAYSALKFIKNSATLNCENCHPQQPVSQEEAITVERTIGKGDLTDSFMYCKNCDSRQNHHMISLISDEDAHTIERVMMLSQQISSVSSSEKGSSRKSAHGLPDGGGHAHSSYESLVSTPNS